MAQRIKLVVAAAAIYLLGMGTTAVMAQGGLSLEGLAEMSASLTGRVDGIEERLAALEAMPEATATPQASTVTVARVSNVRSGPGTNYTVVGQSSAGTVYEVTGKNSAGDWYRIQYDGEAAWVWAGLTDNRSLSVPIVETPTAPPGRRAAAGPAASPAHDGQTVVIEKTSQSYWAAPSEGDWMGTLIPGPGKYAVPPGTYVYVCTKTNNPVWHKILVPEAPDGWVWIRTLLFSINEIHCDE